MDTCRPCGCKSYRSCLICEKEFSIANSASNLSNLPSYVYCFRCEKVWNGWNDSTHPNHAGDPLEFPGIYIEENFLTESEEAALLKDIDEYPWDLSQSGRRKQNFGPKCNFKKRKLKPGGFNGFPNFTRFVQEKFEAVSVLKGFQTIEQCSLEYNPERGASIDPHIDDCWIWGERIVTVNLLADSVLTMTFNENLARYNLDCVETYPEVLNDDGSFNRSKNCFKIEGEGKSVIVRVPMPRRSLLVMYGAARYEWEHRILREDIEKRRVCIAYREFTPPYLLGGENYEKGKSVLDLAKNFWTKPSCNKEIV